MMLPSLRSQSMYGRRGGGAVLHENRLGRRAISYHLPAYRAKFTEGTSCRGGWLLATRIGIAGKLALIVERSDAMLPRM
jgi:hypothetical protein